MDIQGDKGEQGIQGKQGIQGAQGVQGIEGRESIHPWRWRLLTVWIIVFTAVGVLYGRSLTQVSDKIQAERAFSTRLNCEQTNERHDRTLDRVNARYADAIRNAIPQQRAAIENNRQFTISLVDALAPKMNCEDEVNRRVDR